MAFQIRFTLIGFHKAKTAYSRYFALLNEALR
jgi:hypothetical protein